MKTTLGAEVSLVVRAQAIVHALRDWERVAVAFFLYVSCLAGVRHLGLVPCVALVMLAALIVANSGPVSRVVRDLAAMGVILAGYGSVGWFAAPPLVARQAYWFSWDRVILDSWGVRAAIESAGILYAAGKRERVYRFLFMLLSGTFSAYALLPVFPVHGPRVAYPGGDVPQIHGLGRMLNVWVLDHLDIPTSVFPSGHVAVGFASAFGMLTAIRSRLRIWGAFLVLAFLVFLATVYCRYHYEADGLASIAVVTSVWTVSRKAGAYV